MPFNLTTFLALEEFLVVGRPKEMHSQANRYMLATQSQALSSATAYPVAHSFNKHLWCPFSNQRLF